MTTSTMQDLNTTTAEEDEAFKELEKQLGTPVPTQPTPSITDGTLALNTPTGTLVPDINTIINTICTQLQLLATVINSSATQTESENQSLQDCLDIMLQQADWLNAKLADVMDEHYNIGDLVSEGVNDRLSSEVERYFNYSFDAREHFDIDEVVANAIDDKLEDIVAEKLEEYLSNTTIRLERN